MGAWGHRNFENDEALDFVWDITEGGVPAIVTAIKKVADTPESEFIETTESTQALAAIEYIAAAKGKPSEDFPEESEIWLEKNGGKDLLTIDTNTVLKAIERVRTNSELRELWGDSEDLDKWQGVLTNLEERLS
jgi:hypothetical protein